MQLYAHGRRRSVTRLSKQLIGFTRIALDGGATKAFDFEFEVGLLACYGRDMRLVVMSGEVTFSAGGSSDDLLVSATVQIVGPTIELHSRTAFISRASAMALPSGGATKTL